MTREFDFQLAGVSVTRFRADLLAAADVCGQVVQPDGLVEPVRLWLLAAEEGARRRVSLLGYSANAAWNAAQAILDQHRHEQQHGEHGVDEARTR